MQALPMIQNRALSYVRSRPGLKERLRRLAFAVGYDPTDWVRVEMYRSCFAHLRSLGPERLDALEISAGPIWQRSVRFGSYTGTSYPEFDICREVMPRQFDVVIADQIFEHLEAPLVAARNVHAMLRPGGTFVIAVPFLLRVHASPIDCSRWTETGLHFLLRDAGFRPDLISTHSWGNRACLKANLTRWRKRGFFGSLRNEPDFPVMVWAFARRAPEEDAPGGRGGCA